MKLKNLFLPLLLPALASGLFGQAALTISTVSGHAGTYNLGDNVPFSFTLSNTTPPAEGEDAAVVAAENARNTAVNIVITGTLTGTDIYGNNVTIDISFPTVGSIGPGGSVEVSGSVAIPSDGTLHDIETPGYQINVSVAYESDEPREPQSPVSAASSSDILVEVTPNLVFDNVTYRPGTYEGGDLIQLTAFVRNDVPPGSQGQSRPILGLEDFRTGLFLSEDPSIDPGNDFLLGFFTTIGSQVVFDGTGVPGGRNDVRIVREDLTPSLISTFGRDYQPQPNDFNFDIGERIIVTMEVLVPNNYTGSFFVGGYADSLGEIAEIEEASGDDSLTGDNIFIQTLTPQIQIDSSDGTITEPVSEVTDPNGDQVEQSNGVSDRPSTSEDGVWIAFESTATNLDPDQPGNGNRQVYLRNRETREITLISVSNSGIPGNRDSQNPSISADGNYIAFESRATNFVDGAQGANSQIYVYDRVLSRIVRVSENEDGQPANGSAFNPSISEDGRFVAFDSLATNLDPAYEADLSPTSPVRQAYLHDRDVADTGSFDLNGNIATRLVSLGADGLPASGDVEYARVSLDARAVAFVSNAANLDAGYAEPETQIWYRPINPDGVPTGQVEMVSVDDFGNPGKGDSSEPAVNGGPTTPTYGLQIVFASKADNLVPDDTNEVSDIFVRDFSDPLSASTRRVSVSNPRVAFGEIAFNDPLASRGVAPNTPDNQPNAGDTIELNDGVNPPTVFTFVAGLPVNPTDVPISPANTMETRDNLVQAINNAFSLGTLNIVAYASNPPTPPNFADLNGFTPGISLFNTVPGEQGNQDILINSPGLKITAVDMAEGGTQSEDLRIADPDNPFSIAQGSLQPSIDRSGRIVAFRTLSRNLSVVRDGTRFKKNPAQPDIVTPGVGEVLRPLYRASTSNVYYRDRDVNGSGTLDDSANANTARASVNRFGYPTNRLLNIPSSGSSRVPTVSGDGRFIAFASDSENNAGLRFGRSNTNPLDTNGLRDVFTFDRNTVVPVEDVLDNPPFVAITSPTTGSQVSSTAPFFVTASAIGFDDTTQSFNQQSIEEVTIFVNGVEEASITEPPFNVLVQPRGAGPIKIIAVARDDRGLESTSQSVTLNAVTIPGTPPSLTLINPDSTINSSYGLGTTTTFQALLQETAGQVFPYREDLFDSFDFYVNGVVVFSTDELQDVYSFDYTFDRVGVSRITASVTYFPEPTFVRVFSDQVDITVTPDPGPSVSFTSPAPGSSLALNSTVTLSARPVGATTDPIEVEYFLLSETSAGPESLGVATGPNYALDWTVDRTGALSFFAVASQPTGPNGVSERLDVSASVADNLPLVEVVSHDTTNPRTTVESGGTVQLSATATGQNGNRNDIEQVEFFVNGQSVGTGNRVDPPSGAPIFNLEWQPLLPGDADILPSTLTAVVTTTANELVSTSEPVFLDVVGGDVPVISIVQPNSDRMVTVGQSISMAAQASVSGGTISSVRFFYRNTPGNVSSANLIGEDTTSPYTASFTPTSEGTYYIYAVATSNSGRDSAPTPPVAVTAGPLGPPTVSLVSPPAEVTVGSDLLLSAEAGDADGDVTVVRFFANGVEIGTSSGSQASGNVYTVEWSPSVAGDFDIVAEAIDGDGLSSQSNTETVKVNPEIGSAPIVSAGALPSGESLGRYLLGSTVVLRASARDLDGTIEEVQIFMNGTEVASFSEEPYTVPFTFSQEGSFVLSAFARDNDGNVTVSSVQLFSLDANLPIPEVDITSPGSSLAVQPGEEVQIVAEADGQGNELGAVQFFDNGSLFTQSDSEPYTATFSSDELGTRVIQALAFYTTEITFFQPDGGEITLTFAASNVSDPVNVTVAESINLPGYGDLLPVDPDNGEFFSGTVGRLFFGTSDPMPGQWAYAFDLDSWVIGISGSTLYSPDFGYISPSGAQQAFESSAFGGTVYWFERDEDDTFLWLYSVNLGYIGKPLGTQPYFYVQLLDSWIVVTPNGAIYSFAWEWIRPTAPFVFESSSQGTLYMTDDPSMGGAVYSLQRRQFLYP